MATSKTIMEQLRQAAISSGISMKRLADDSGLYYASVHGFMRDGRDLTLRSAQKLARVLGFELKLSRLPKRRK